MSEYIGEPKRPDQPSPDYVASVAIQSEKPLTLEALAEAAVHMAKVATGTNASPSPIERGPSQWALDQQEAKRAKGESKASGSTSSTPSLETADTAEAWAKEAKRKGKKAVRLANQSPERRGLSSDVKARLVTSFACFQSLTTIRDWLKSDFGLVLDDRTVVAYDCGRLEARVGRRLRSLYTETRKHYVATSANMAVAHQAHRLKLIGQIVEKATISKDYAAALKGLELAAKEMGGALDGKTTVVHQGTVAHVHGNVEDARAELTMRLAQVLDGGTLLSLPPPADAHAVATLQAPPTEGE